MPAIQATFSDFKLIKSRSVVQLVLELPIEAADAALASLGGIPQPGAERWVAVAPLLLEPIAMKPLSEGKVAEAKAAVKALATTEGERARVRAVMLCKDERFQEWIIGEGFAVFGNRRHGAERHGTRPYRSDTEAWAAGLIRSGCRIASRSELATNAEACQQFRRIEEAYKAETGLIAEER